MTDIENNNITVKDWLDYIKSEKQLLANAEKEANPKLISLGTLFIISIVSIFRQSPYNYFGWVGIIFSFVLIIYIAKSLNDVINIMAKLNETQIKILAGILQEPKEIAKELVLRK
jgi:hypothetical protein